MNLVDFWTSAQQVHNNRCPLLVLFSKVIFYVTFQHLCKYRYANEIPTAS
jgi:hypothetical protein